MIPLCGIAIGIAVIVLFLLTHDRQDSLLTTKEEENELTNKLNRMALDRGNKEKP
jgi:hypothetical protein